MRERPIIMSADSVRAILAGTKTMTRRVVRIDDTPIVNAKPGKLQRGIPTNAVNVRHIGCYLKCDAPVGSDTVSARVPCPYGAAGSHLWVRESFVIGYPDGRGGYSLIPPTGSTPERDGRPTYRASFCERPDEPRMCWRSPIHMPRWASRLTLEIASVRVERVQAISEADARAEGYPIGEPVPVRINGERVDMVFFDPRYAFAAAWDAVNGRRAGCSWRDNPWCWVLEFRRVEGT